MQKKQVLLDGKILTYYQNSTPLSNSLLPGERTNCSPFPLAEERIQDRDIKGKNVLLFLHGWMQDGTSFNDICKILEKKNISYVCLDLPGFGNSQLIHDDMTIEEYGEIVIHFIEKLKLINPVLLGHSFGGRISIYLGSFYKNIDKIVLLCAAGISHKMPLPKYFIIKTGKIILSLPGLRSLGKKIQKGFSSPDLKNAGMMEKIFRNTISLDLQDKMKQIKYPTLMIWGKDDDQTPVYEGEIIHGHIQNSQFHVLDGTHFVHQEQAEKITNMILDFTQK